MNPLIRLRNSVLSGLLALLVGCGGGGTAGSGGAAPAAAPRVHIQGVAAVGAALVGPVYLKDSTGATMSTMSDVDGTFRFDVSALTPPFMLRVQQPDGTFLYSASVDGGITDKVTNINPLSNLILGTLSASISGAGPDPNALYQGFGSFASYLTVSRIDRATATVYGEMSPAFKAKLGSHGIDFNPIYGAYQIGDALDQTLDTLEIFYDTQSGDFQEKDTALIKVGAFGPLGGLSSLANAAGRYSGQAQVVLKNGSGAITSSRVEPVTMLVDNAGNVFMAFGGSHAVYGLLAPTTGQLSGYLYALDALGNATTGGLNIVGSTMTKVNNTLQVTLSIATAGLTSNIPTIVPFTLTPDVNATYGNNLKASASTFKSTQLGPFAVGNGTGPRFGSSASSRTMYFYGASISASQNAGCSASNSWSFDLADLELSLYTAALTEHIAPTSDTATCLFASEDAVGTAMFTDTGLLVFFADAATAASNGVSHTFVSVKRWSPN